MPLVYQGRAPACFLAYIQFSKEALVRNMSFAQGHFTMRYTKLTSSLSYNKFSKEALVRNMSFPQGYFTRRYTKLACSLAYIKFSKEALVRKHVIFTRTFHKETH